MNIEEVKELMARLEESKLSKLVLKRGDFEIQLEKESAYLPLPKPRVVHAEPESAFHSETAPKAEKGARTEAPGTHVTSPMVGTFYGSPGPDHPPFVKVGDKVSVDTVVCIVEAMKVMNEVKAGLSGTVAEVLAETAQPVEFGTRLLRIV